MNEAPLISVIIPVYNVEAHLRRALDSVCGQSYRNLEIICVDDGSTDASAAILNEYAAREHRIRLIMQANAGASAARNAGLDAATGEWVTGLDADDFLVPHAYETLISESTGDEDIILFSSQLLKENAPPDDTSLKKRQTLYDMPLEGRKTIEDGDFHGVNVCIWSKLFRRSILEQNHIRFVPELYSSEDGCFVLQYYAHVKTAYFTQKRLHGYWVHEGSVSAPEAKVEQRNKRCLSNILCFQHIISYYKRRGLISSHHRLLNQHLLICFNQMCADARVLASQATWVRRFADMLDENQVMQLPEFASAVDLVMEKSRCGELGDQWLAACRERALHAQQNNHPECCHVAVVADKKALPACAALLQSLKENSHAHPLCAHVFGIALPPFAKQRLGSMSGNNFYLYFHEVDEDMLALLPASPKDASRRAYVNIALPELLPEVTHLIVLEPGLIVLNDIAALWQEASQTELIACMRESSDSQKRDYSAMVMNLANMRTQRTAQARMEACLMNHKPLQRQNTASIRKACSGHITLLAEPHSYGIHKANDNTESSHAEQAVFWHHYYRNSPLSFLPLPQPVPDAAPTTILLAPHAGDTIGLRLKKIFYSVMETLTRGKRRKKYQQKRRCCSILLRDMQQQQKLFEAFLQQQFL